MSGTKPSINWDHVAPEYVAMATNGYRKTLLFCGVPEKVGESWLSEYGSEVVRPFASFVPGTCDWRDSLVIRPGYKEGKE